MLCILIKLTFDTDQVYGSYQAILLVYGQTREGAYLRAEKKMFEPAAICIPFIVLLVIWLNVPRVIWNLYRQWKAVRHIPGWPTHWLYGNSHQWNKIGATQALKYRKDIAEFGWKLSRVWFGPFLAIVMIHHTDPLKKVLKCRKSDRVYNLIKPWLGDGLLVAQGEKWSRNRRLLTPAFHYAILKPYVATCNDCIKVLVKKWQATAAEGKPVKLFETISFLSLDIILQCAFGYVSDCQTSIHQAEYVSAVRELTDHCTDRFINPLYHVDWLYWITPHGRRMSRLCKCVHNHAEKIIAERKKTLGLDKEQKDFDASTFLERLSQSRKLDFLDILLTAVDEDGVGLSDLEIRNEVDTFMFEGHDTTTSGMCWALYCLARYPEHQQKVREEVNSVLSGREQLTYDDLKELKYTQGCIKEAMRIYAPVDAIFRETDEDMELEGHLIPKGMIISIPINFIHNNPHVWPNPEEYDPTRFFPGNAEGRDPYAYLPFSAGYRNCIGQNFALNEEKTVIASIIRHFKLTLDENHHVEFIPRLILTAMQDIKLYIEPLDL